MGEVIIISCDVRFIQLSVYHSSFYRLFVVHTSSLSFLDVSLLPLAPDSVLLLCVSFLALRWSSRPLYRERLALEGGGPAAPENNGTS